MGQDREIYACIECGLETPKWMGKCTRCGSWGSFKKVISSPEGMKGSKGKVKSVIKKARSTGSRRDSRLRTGFLEFDRVLGGGIVSGEVILIGGEPGIGKTTLLLQLLDNIISSKSKNGVYVTSEESLEQISIHSKRLGFTSGMDIICDNDIDSILSALKGGKYSLAIIDSIQTVKTDDLRGLPGGIGQVRECTSRIVEFANREGVAVVLIGHITKGGDLAGPKVLEHMVDGVFYLEGESASSIRLLRGIKNRFGSTREIGVLKFSSKGFSDAKNPSEAFVLSKDSRVGVCKGAIFEGNRIILVEVQGLISKSTFSFPQRIVSGIKKAKVQMLCAVLSKYTKANLLDKDVYINIANGLKVEDSSLDLALCTAILSSQLNKKISSSTVAIGEVSLTGQIYLTDMFEEKIKALNRLGYKRLLVAQDAKGSLKKRGKDCIVVDSAAELAGSF